MNNEQYRLIIYNLREVIEESGMKQKVVAERCEMTARKLNDILCFRKRLDVDTIPAFCKVLNVKPERFFRALVS